MKTNYRTNKTFFLALLVVVLTACGLSDVAESPERNVSYIQEFTTSSQVRFMVDDNGGFSELTARVANPTAEPVSFSIKMDKSLLDTYNKENNTSFSVLPDELYDLQLLDGDQQVLQEGKDLNIVLEPKEYGKKVRLMIKTMMLEHKDEATGEVKKEPLSYYKNYAVPVSMSNVNGEAVLQSSANSGIFFLNRKFTMPVMHLDGSIGLIYKENTMPQTPDKKYDGDIKYPEWTCQYSFRLDVVNNNTGLMYPNLRTSTDSPLYMTLYGGKLTLFAAGGKVGLNQPKFKDFEFVAKKWYHMAISFKEEGGRPNLKLYINGELAYKSVWPKKVDEWPIIFLGNNSFKGYVRELRFWSRALTEGEINETLWFANPESEGLEVYLPLSADKKGIIKGKENDWLEIPSAGSTNFDTKFTFPAED